MARFEGAKRVDRKEARMGFSLGERLKAAGFEVAKSELQERVEADKEEVRKVGSAVDSPEVDRVNTEAEQALDETVEVAEAELSEVEAQVPNKELSLQKETLIKQVDRLANDAEEIAMQISGAQKIVEETMASGGIIPKSLRKLSESYDEGEKGFQGVVESMKDLIAGLSTIGATDENLNAGKARMEELSVRVGIFKRFFKDLLDKKMKMVRIDAGKMQERGDGELEDSVEKLTYLNEQFFNDVESLGANCDAVAKGEFESSRVERPTSRVEQTASNIEGLASKVEVAPRVSKHVEVIKENPVKPKTKLVDTSEIDEGWEDDQNISEMRKTLRGGFVPTVIEGGKGKTEIAETGPTGTLVGEEKEMEAGAKAHTAPELLKDISYPGPDDRKTTIGEDYLSLDDLDEIDRLEGKGGVIESRNIESEGVSLREAVEEDAEENERINKLKNEEEPLSLREMMEMEEAADTSVPDIVPDMGGESLRSALEAEREKEEKEQELMDLLKQFEGVSEISEDDRNKVVAEGESLLESYTDEYGKEERQKLAEKWVDRFGDLLSEAADRKKELAESKTVSPFVESAIAAAGAAAAAKALEMGGETLREGDVFRDAGNDGGSFEDTILSKDFTREHWSILTKDEQQRMLELFSEIDAAEFDLNNLKNARNAMERTFRSEYGEQFDTSAKAQKRLREKANQIAKLEALLLRSKNEQKALQQKARDRVNEKNAKVIHTLENVSSSRLRDDAWENEVFPAKSSWWKEHPRLRKAAIGGGVVVGAGLFVGALGISKLLTPIIHPFKTLEFLGNAGEKFFKFIDRVFVKGDPLGAVSDAAKSAEKFFDDKMNKAEEKTKHKGGKGVKYSSTD